MDLKDNFRKSTLAYFSVLIKKLIKAFDQSLFEHANSATSNQEQNRYYEAMQEFRKKSPQMIERYQQFLSTGIEDFFAGRNDTVDQFDQATDELTLIDKETLENELAISILSSKANTRYSESLWKLNRRLAVVRGGQKVDDETNPCGPTHLSHALQASTDLLAVDNRIKIQLYKMFDKVVMPRAGELYEKLNNHFVDNKVLPNLRFQAAEGSNASGAGSSAGGVSEGQGADAGSQEEQSQMAWINAQEEVRQQELISAVRSLQGAGTNQGAARTATASGADFGSIKTGGQASASSFSGNDFAFVLSALQQKLQMPNAGNLSPAKSVEYVEKSFIDQLTQLSAGQGHNTIVEEDANTIDLVGMLFKYVLDDPKLPDAVKSLLSHLHTPMLKVALIDKAFFMDATHPARRLLNLMSEIGGRWITEEDGDKLVLPKLRSIVSRVHRDFVDDLSLFDDLLKELGKFANTLEKRAELTEKRNTEAEKGLERLASARLRATEEIATRMEGQAVPERARELLEEPWTDFLAFNLLRHGDEGLTWDSALKVVNGVIWSVQNKSSREDLDKLRKMQQQLGQSISEGLSTIGYDDEASKALLADLSKAQEIALEFTADSDMEQEHELVEDECDDDEVAEKVAEKEEGVVEEENVVEEDDVVESAAEEGLEKEIVDQDKDKVFEHLPVNDSNEQEVTVGSVEMRPPSSEQIVKTKPSISKVESAANEGEVTPIPPDKNKESETEEQKKTESSENKATQKNTAINRQIQRQQQKMANLDDELSAIYDELDNLEFGTWYEFKQENNEKTLLLKLAWFSSISDHYMFVNRAGVKSAVNTRMELAEGIRSGDIKPLDGRGKSFMERAMESILGRLKLSA